MNIATSILADARQASSWQDFYRHKTENHHLSRPESDKLLQFIREERYLALCDAWEADQFPSALPIKRTVNKEGSQKKRVVYFFEGDEGLFLKYIAWQLFRFDDHFYPNCYAFRRSYGVKDAIRHIRCTPHLSKQYCLKVDISDYFNSIDIETLLTKLSFLCDRDPALYKLFARILQEEQVRENGHIIRELHGAMAGTPISPFFANVYLRDVDAYFHDNDVTYFRYSDDILLFADSLEELTTLQETLYSKLRSLKLRLNPDKIRISTPGETWEFLGFAYRNGAIDLSDNTIRKTKAKIRRKAEALRRWQRKKGLPPEKAAIGLIHTMNRKFYGYPDVPVKMSKTADTADETKDTDDADFTWSRWFFPCLTVDTGLHELDVYFQEYIRYAVTGRHYKGNFRIRYEKLKQWGYVSLVHAYYENRN